MANKVDREDLDETNNPQEPSRGGQELPAELQDRPEQNVGYDEAVKGAPLTPEEKERAEDESPVA
jgi:hypothetical protein